MCWAPGQGHSSWGSPGGCMARRVTRSHVSRDAPRCQGRDSSGCPLAAPPAPPIPCERPMGAPGAGGGGERPQGLSRAGCCAGSRRGAGGCPPWLCQTRRRSAWNALPGALAPAPRWLQPHALPGVEEPSSCTRVGMGMELSAPGQGGPEPPECGERGSCSCGAQGWWSRASRSREPQGPVAPGFGSHESCSSGGPEDPGHRDLVVLSLANLAVLLSLVVGAQGPKSPGIGN